MTYAIFKYQKKDKINELISALSLLTLQDEKKIDVQSVGNISSQYKKISTLSTDELLGICANGELSSMGVTVVKFIKTFKSDKHLLSIGESYLGCILTVPKKKELIERISFYDKLAKNNGLPSKFFVSRGSEFSNYLQSIGLSNIEIEELDKISLTLAKPLEKWAKKREKVLLGEMGKLPKLITKNF
jgi:hypothetical protein